MSILVDLSYINSEKKAKESVAIYAFRVLDGIDENKHSTITLLVAEEYKYFFENNYNSYKLLVFPRLTSKVYRIPYIKGLCKLLKWKNYINKLNFDVIYIPFAWSGNSLKTKSKKVITIHDLRPMREAERAFTNTWWFKALNLSVIYLKISRLFYTLHTKNAYKIITISNYVKNDISKEWPQYTHKMQTIYNGIILSNKTSKPKEIVTTKPYILYVNSLSQYKNVETLIKAFAYLKDQCEHNLVIVGKETNYWKSLTTYIKANAISNRIIRITYATDEELTWLYKHASVFVTTSTREGFGYTPIEAAMCECPVISTMAESLPDVTAGKVNYYDPPKSWNKLSNLILTVLNNAQTKSDLKEIAIYFSERYDNEKQANKILQLLESILDN